jgi:predicted RNA-binding Zn ribbon-like protein
MTVTRHELIEEFVNTLHKDAQVADEELLTNPAELAGWFSAHGLARPERVSAADLMRAKALREALRTLLLGNNALEVDAGAAWAVLEETSRRARIELRFADGLPVLTPTAGGAAGELGQIVVAVSSAMTDGTWSRLKACRARDCEWAFFDQAKNQSRAWCSMTSCGNREKARAFRDRQESSKQ